MTVVVAAAAATIVVVVVQARNNHIIRVNGRLLFNKLVLSWQVNEVIIRLSNFLLVCNKLEFKKLKRKKHNLSR